MDNVTVIDHPLVQHKLSLMRRKETPTAKFRQLLREISLLLGYEVTRDLPLETEEIETPLAKMQAPTLAGKKLVLISILRAGNGLLEGMLDLMPSARVGHVGLYRDPETLDGAHGCGRGEHDPAPTARHFPPAPSPRAGCHKLPPQRPAVLPLQWPSVRPRRPRSQKPWPV